MRSVLVDTCIWSLALRGKFSRDISISQELIQLIQADRVNIIGPAPDKLA